MKRSLRRRVPGPVGALLFNKGDGKRPKEGIEQWRDVDSMGVGIGEFWGELIGSDLGLFPQRLFLRKGIGFSWGSEAMTLLG